MGSSCSLGFRALVIMFESLYSTVPWAETSARANVLQRSSPRRCCTIWSLSHASRLEFFLSFTVPGRQALWGLQYKHAANKHWRHLQGCTSTSCWFL